MTNRNSARGTFSLQRKFQLAPVDLLAALALSSLVTLLLSSALTAWFAHRLGYRAILGTPWFSWGALPYYAPWKWHVWRAAVAEHFPHSWLVARTASLDRALGALGLATFAFVLLKRVQRRANRIDVLHGSGHLATREEVLESGLVGHTRGSFLAKYPDLRKKTLRFLRHVGATHTLISGPPRSGKDAGNFLPDALDPQPDESAILIDPKGDAAKMSSGYREAQGHRVLHFAPNEPPHLTARYNPLQAIRIGTHREVADAQLLASSWLNGDGLGFKGNNAIFAFAARPLFAACFLHVLYRERLRGPITASMEHVMNEFMPVHRSFDESVLEWLTFAHDPEFDRGWKLPDGKRTATHPMIASASRAYLSCDKKLRQNVQFCITSALELLLDDCLRANLSACDFQIDDLVNGDQPTSLYLVYPMPSRERLAPILRVMLEQIFQRLTESMAVRNGKVSRPHKYKLHAMLNEFPMLGRMDAIAAAMPVCPSFGIRVSLYVQDPAQLREVYGPQETLSAQCPVRVFYPPNRYETAKEISEYIGKTTVTYRQPSNSPRQLHGSEHEVARHVLDPDEIMRMPRPTKAIDEHGEERITAPGDVIVFKAGLPIYAQQILFWDDPVLLARSQLIHTPSVGGRKLPTLAPLHPEPEARPAPPLQPSTSSVATPPADPASLASPSALDVELAALEELNDIEPFG